MSELDLSKLRKEIDQHDREFLIALSGRMKIVELVGQYKQKHSLPPLDQARWQQVITQRQEWAAELGLDPNLVSEIFELIHGYALKIESTPKVDS